MSDSDPPTITDPAGIDPAGIDVAACRARQARLLEWMRTARIELVILTQSEHVQWLTGPRFAPVFQTAAAINEQGKTFLVAPHKEPDSAAADEIATFAAKQHSTLRNDQRQACHETLRNLLRSEPPAAKLGVEFSTFGRHEPVIVPEHLVDVDPVLLKLRRRKSPDELVRIRRAISATEKMYERARDMIRPGVCEIDVFNQLQGVAVEEFGEPLTGTGNDYQCASRGGAPRAFRRAADGELYILDLGPAFRGYYADNARTIAVTEPSAVQLEAWRHVVRVFDHIEETVCPGKSAQRLFHEIQEQLDQAPVGVFNHHLGHGIGLFPHEAPHLNPHWNDTFEVGDVFAVEPGLYATQLRAGMRIENNYLVTETGVELLTPFPLELRVS